MNWTRKRAAGAAGLMAALAIAAPAGAANAQTPTVSPLAGFPATPLLPPDAAAASAWALEGGLATLPAVPAVSEGGQLAYGGTFVGVVINAGGTSITSNGGPIDSGNVINSP
jgi:CubicO group peptidase (beta-lactamase class C family)